MVNGGGGSGDGNGGGGCVSGRCGGNEMVVIMEQFINLICDMKCGGRSDTTNGLLMHSWQKCCGANMRLELCAVMRN